MTATPGLLGSARDAVSFRRPISFDLMAHYEPSAHFQFTRRVRNDFDGLAKEYAATPGFWDATAGGPSMQTDIEGIGVACRVEIGRLVMREGSQLELISSAMRMFRECQERELASGAVSRIVVHFSKADERPNERLLVQQAFHVVFADDPIGIGGDCSFLSNEIDRLELGRCVVYQTLTNYLREDGVYHSAHRSRIDRVQRHLQQEVGRYENHRFFLRAHDPVDGGVPQIDFCYTGESADARVEAFLVGYTEEQVEFVPLDVYREGTGFVGLGDYERASRRFGGLWILQSDLVRLLMPQQSSVLYLFFDDDLQPELDRAFTWDDLRERQRVSPNISQASRRSQTYLDMVLEGLLRNDFVVQDGDRFRLAPGFADYRHVTFYQLGEYRKRQILSRSLPPDLLDSDPAIREDRSPH